MKYTQRYSYEQVEIRERKVLQHKQMYQRPTSPFAILQSNAKVQNQIEIIEIKRLKTARVKNRLSNEQQLSTLIKLLKDQQELIHSVAEQLDKNERLILEYEYKQKQIQQIQKTIKKQLEIRRFMIM